MQHDWFMYHLRSTYKNRLDFPFKFKALSISYAMLPLLKKSLKHHFISKPQNLCLILSSAKSTTET